MQIILADDEADSRHSIAQFLRKLGHTVTECSDGAEAYRTFLSGDYPMVLSDIRMPLVSGLDLLGRIVASPRVQETDVVLFTGHGTMESAIDALRKGAFDYLLKPINIQELAVLVDRIANHQALVRENKRLNQHLTEEVAAATEETRQELVRLKRMVTTAEGLEGVQFYSEAMRDIKVQALMYHHDRQIPVLIEGETGTGKEVIARYIHHGEAASLSTFVDINCAAVNASLFESELFGYEGGSYTGAIAKGQKGKFDLAMGGTLFLDEVGEIPMELQGKLLRVLQEREYYRVGGLKKIKADIRLVCATNVDLVKAVEDGRFRKDLYYRLKVGSIRIPPLRQRKEDIISLAYDFLKRFAKEKGKRFNDISEGAQELLLHHTWPGNVRELRSVVELAVFLYDDIVLKPEYLKVGVQRNSANSEQNGFQKAIATPQEPFNLDDHVDRIILETVKMFKGNQTAAANYLGLSRRILSYRVGQIQDKKESIMAKCR